MPDMEKTSELAVLERVQNKTRGYKMNKNSHGTKTIIGYFKRQKELMRKLADVEKQREALDQTKQDLQDKLRYAREVTEVYRGYPLAVNSDRLFSGVQLVTLSEAYIAANPYQATHDCKPFLKNGNWVISVIYRPVLGYVNNREEIFYTQLSSRQKAKAYELAKDVVVVLAGGKSTKLAAKWASQVKRKW